MTIGIYILHWDADLIYVGQSQNIESRFVEHKYKLKKEIHTNYQLQRTYKHKGLPKLEIIEECSLDSLNDREIYWTNHYDSIRNGLNIVEAGNSSAGVLARNSKYTKFQVLRVFSLLYSTAMDIKNIQLKTKTRTLAHDISRFNSHLWLSEDYPEQYEKMRQKNRRSSSRIRKENFKVVDPTGNYYNISNAVEFCKIHDLPYRNFNRILNGYRKQYKGWRLV